MKCPNIPKDKYAKIAKLTGISRANELIDRYGEDIPAEELVNKMNEYFDKMMEGEISKSDIYVPDAEEKALKSKKELKNASTTEKVIYKLRNKIRELEGRKLGSGADKKKISAQVFDLQESIAKLRKGKKLSDVVKIVNNGITNWVVKEVIDAKSPNAVDIRKAIGELDLYRTIIDDLLEYKNVNGKLKYKITNSAITNSAEKAIELIGSTRRQLTPLIESTILRSSDNYLNKKMTVDELRHYVDIGLLTSEFRDIGATNNKVASFIHKITKSKELNIMAELYDTVEKPLQSLQKETGIDLTKEEHNNIFLMKDTDGKALPYLISEHNLDYYKFKTELTARAAAVKRFALNGKTNSKKVSALNKTIKEDIKKHYDVVDTSKLISKNEDIRNSEIDRLIEKYGEEKGRKYAEEALDKYNSYTEDLEAYEEIQSRKLVSEDLSTNSLMAQVAVNRFKNFNDPLNIIEGLNTANSNKLFTNSSINSLVMIPDYSKAGVSKKFRNSEFDAMMKDGNKKKMFDFIKNSIETSLTYLPSHVGSKLDGSFLPDIMEKGFMDVLRDGGLRSAVKHSLVNAVSITEHDSKQYGVLDADNNAIKKVPIQFTSNILRTLEYKINRADKVIEENLEMIQAKKDRLESVKGEVSKEAYAKLEERFKEQAEKLSTQIAEYQELLPELNKKYKEALKSKNTSLGDAIKQFAAMSLNYKHKYAIQDVMELTRRYIHEDAEKIVQKGDKSLKTAIDEYVVEKGSSNLEKIIDMHLDASLYGKYKKSGGTSGKYIGLTPEAKKAITDHKALKVSLKDKLRSKEITEDEYIKQLDESKENLVASSDVKLVTLTKAGDMLNSLIYKVNLGWNPKSALMNVVYGRISNSTEASMDRFFNASELKSANKLMTSAFSKAATGMDNTTADKIRNFMMKYGTVYDLIDDSYGSNKGLSDREKKLGFLNAMEGQRRGEYYNQGAVLLALAHRQKMMTKDGKEVTLWDAVDVNGDLKENIVDRDKWKLYTEDGSYNEAHKFRTKVNRVVQRLHGNYDIHSPINIKKSLLGRYLMTFKSFLPEMIASRFEKERYDEELDYTVKGRFNTYKDLGVKRSLDLMKKVIAEKYFKHQMGEHVAYDKIDIENMKGNVQELQYGLAIIAMSTLLGMVLSDDEKETFAMRHTFDLLSRAQSDITLYFNPVEMGKMIKNPFPQLEYITRVGKATEATYKFSTMDDKHHDIEYLLRNYAKLTPFAKHVYRTFYADLSYTYK